MNDPFNLTTKASERRDLNPRHFTQPNGLSKRNTFAGALSPQAKGSTRMLAQQLRQGLLQGGKLQGSDLRHDCGTELHCRAFKIPFPWHMPRTTPCLPPLTPLRLALE